MILQENSRGNELMPMQDATRVRSTVEQYHRDHRHPDRPQPIPHDIVSITDWATTDASFDPGVYALYSADGHLLYIGKASHGRTVGSRLKAHEEASRFSAAAFVQIFEVAEAFEAPSFEEYLISRLDPPENKHGKPTVTT